MPLKRNYGAICKGHGCFVRTQKLQMRLNLLFLHLYQLQNGIFGWLLSVVRRKINYCSLWWWSSIFLCNKSAAQISQRWKQGDLLCEHTNFAYDPTLTSIKFPSTLTSKQVFLILFCNTNSFTFRFALSPWATCAFDKNRIPFVKIWMKCERDTGPSKTYHIIDVLFLEFRSR